MVETDMLKKTRVVYARHDSLVPDAIMTFPSKERSTISATAYASRMIFPEDEAEVYDGCERFLSECDRRGIIPFLTIEWSYDSETGVLRPAAPPHRTLFPVANFGPGHYQKTLDQIVRGGRVHVHYFKEIPLDVFARRLLVPNLMEDYAFVQGDLRTINRNALYEGIFSFKAFWDDEIILDVQENSGAGKTPFSEWFDGLDSRYHDLRK